MARPIDVEPDFEFGPTDSNGSAATREILDDPYVADDESAFASLIAILGWLTIAAVAFVVLVALLWIAHG